jgi:Tfp pilus assembly protein PilF
MNREAVETFTKGIAVDPKHSSSYLGLGTAYQALGEKEKAKEIFQKGIAVADERGDVMPMKKMQARLGQLMSDDAS